MLSARGGYGSYSAARDSTRRSRPVNAPAAVRTLTPSLAAQALAFVGLGLVMFGNYYGYDAIGPVAELLSQQLHFSDNQIGSLNGIYSLPNIFLVPVGGVLVDRYGARAVTFVCTAICLVGAVVTALGDQFGVMALGRLLYGIGSETLAVSVLVALAQWYSGGYMALLFALNLSLARLGSSAADLSTSFARGLYERGWQGPPWLAPAFPA